HRPRDEGLAIHPGPPLRDDAHCHFAQEWVWLKFRESGGSLRFLSYPGGEQSLQDEVTLGGIGSGECTLEGGRSHE
ncbi:MAG TPA: hypothetical protein VFP37_06055, partial [Steroidobacteraceae bacterium]|nr:hypothetical protein [Steroidobacteraceae bacterium]